MFDSFLFNTAIPKEPKATPSLFSGRRVRVKGDAAVPIPAGSTPQTAQPSVEVVRDGDHVEAIHVTCRCGCRMRIVCEYDDPSTP